MATLPVDVFARVTELFDRGLYLQALQVGQACAPLAIWSGVEERTLAARLAARLGGWRLASRLHYLAWRNNRRHPSALVYMAYTKMMRGRLLSAWSFLRAHDSVFAHESARRSDWLLAKTQVLGKFRDFERAEAFAREAQPLAEEPAWWWLVWSQLLQSEDRYEESLAAALQALELKPLYLPALGAAAYGLTILNGDEEALQLLSRAADVMESGEVFQHLAAIHFDQGAYQEACRCYSRAQACLVLLEPPAARELAGAWAEAAYLAGDLDRAVELSEKVAPEYHQRFVGARQVNGAGKRQVLTDVPFIKQHHVTCAPATLAAVAAYWSVPAEHLEIAEEICYDGTPAHSQRRWAEQHGFLTREFRVTWETVVALIDRKVPVLLGTLGAEMGHMQAIVGYDSVRRSMMIRDPTHRTAEYYADALLSNQEAHGPRGMVMVPPEHRDRLDGIDLLDADIYDEIHALYLALGVHDRYRAQAIMDGLITQQANHPIVLSARRALAAYDSDVYGMLAIADQLLEQFPQDVNLLLYKLNCLEHLGRRRERMVMLHDLCSGPLCHPVFWRLWAEELQQESRHSREAFLLLRRVSRYMPHDGSSIASMSTILWDWLQREEACELARLAACLEDKVEHVARQYFGMAQAQGHSDQALEFLNDRFERFGQKSSFPAITLSAAQERLGQGQGALQTLERALQRRPQDADLLMASAAALARYGEPEKSRQRLLAARSLGKRGLWLRRAAALADSEHSPAAAMARWREVLELEPMALDAHQALVQKLGETQGVQAAVNHLRQACRRFPRCIGLRSMLLNWVRHQGPMEVEPVAREILDFQPVSIEARGDLAIALSEQGRLREAFHEAQIAQQLQPTNPGTHVVLGRLYQQVGDRTNAAKCYRAAIQLDPDNAQAIVDAVTSCATPDEARDALDFIYQQFLQRRIQGDGLLAFRQLASQVYQPPELLRILREAHGARPDLWQVWSALVQQLLDMGLTAEALSVAEAARDRFPLSAKSWHDLAMVQTSYGLQAAALSSLQNAVRLSPEWTPATRDLVMAHLQADDSAAARSLLERSIARYPGVPSFRYLRAEMKWLEGAREEALEDLKAGLRQNESQQSRWDQLLEWCRELNRPEQALSLARECNPNAGLMLVQDMLQSDPQNPKLRLERAQLSGILGQWEPCFEELQDSLRCFPQDVGLRDALAEALMFHGRFDEATAICRRQPHGRSLDPLLQVRVAQIELSRRNTQTALDQLWEIVEDFPDCLQAWELLADSFRELANPEQQARVAENLTRLDPNRAEAWGFLGSIQHERGKLESAIGALERAIELDPHDPRPARQLFRLHLGEGDLHRAEESLERFAAFVPYHEFLIEEVLLRSHQKKLDAALASFQESCRSHLVAPSDAIAAIDALISCGGQDDTRNVMEAEILRGTASLVTRMAWVYLYAREEDLEACAEKIDSTFAAEGLWEAMACSYLECLGEKQQKAILSDYLQTHRERLRGNTNSWSAAGQALADADDIDEALNWYTGWQNRQGLTPQMLHPLVYCYMVRRQLRQAAEVSRRALGLPPDESFEFHQLWCLSEAVMTGDRKTAYDLLQQIDMSVVQSNEYLQVLFQLLHMVLTSRVSELTGQATTYREAVARIRGLATAHPLVHSDSALRYLYYQGLLRIALDHHRPLAAAYAKLRSKMR